jgi:signal transduction histidine kinase
MFKSARIKLTFFYLAIVVILSLMLTIGTRILAQRAFDDSTSMQQGGISNIVHREVGLPIPRGGFDNLRDQQDALIHHQLNEYVFWINVVAIILGGIGSYWYAGRALKPIEEAHEAQARFASDASHELRTPLAVMKTENEVFLRQKSFTDTEAREQVASNLEEIQHLEELTANLLSLANYEDGERLELSSIKAGAVANLAVEQLNKLHPKENKRVVIDVADNKILGHKVSLAQAITIFLDNAVKYSPDDKPIKLIGVVDDDYYKFMVEDSGPGIKPEDMPQIFDRLYRGDKTRSKNVPGNGLGLSLAKEIAKANDAGLSVSNIKDAGARFTLTIKIV